MQKKETGKGSPLYHKMVEGMNCETKTKSSEEVPQDRCAFANVAMLDKKLEMLNISWELAVELVSGAKRHEDILFIDVRDMLVSMVRNFFDIGRSCASSGLVWKSLEMIMRAVATPGVKEKSKIFRLLPLTSEAKYRNSALKIVLCATRIWALRVSKDQRSDALEMGDVVFAKVQAIMSTVLKRLEEEEERENSKKPGLNDCASHQPTDDQHTHPKYTKNISTASNKKEVELTLLSSLGPGNDAEIKACVQNKNEKYLKTPSQDWETRLTDAKLIHNFFWAVCSERQYLNDNIPTPFVCTFTSCLGVIQMKNNAIQLSMGKHISPVLAAFGYASSISGLLRICHFSSNGDRDTAIREVEELQTPGRNCGINMIQELLAKTRYTRQVEESHGSWSRCLELSHKHCGYVYGKHLSALDVGKKIKMMQKSFFVELFGRSGIFASDILSEALIRRIKNLKDDPWNETIHYSLLKHIENSAVVNECLNAVKTVLHKMCVDHSDSETIASAVSLLRKIECLAVKTQTLLHLSGGMAGRGREVAFQRVRNSEKGGRRSCFLFLGKLIMIPGYTKTTSMKINANLVCRSPDEVSSFIFKCFLLFVIPLRNALDSICHTADNDESEPYVSVSDYLISSKTTRLDAASAMAREWQKYGLDLTHHEYRQWNGGYARMRSELDGSLSKLFQNYLISEKEQSESDDHQLDSILQLQSGHGISTANIHYGRHSKSFAENGKLSEDDVNMFISASKLWHMDTGLYNQNVLETIAEALGSLSSTAIPKKIFPAHCEPSNVQFKVCDSFSQSMIRKKTSFKRNQKMVSEVEESDIAEPNRTGVVVSGR